MAKSFDHSAYNLKRYHRLRAEYIELLGGKCACCGSVDQLHFDHINPETKSFTVGSCLTFPKKVVLAELEKCQLLCQECHILKTKENKDGYGSRARGSEVNTSKLTAELVLEIREKMKSKLSDLTLAREYGVTKATMYQIRNRMTWKHIQ